MNDIPLVDLKTEYRAHRKELLQAWDELCESSAFILGKPVEEFERAFAEFLGVPHVIGVANGTDALELAVRALEIGPGDEVIVPAMTFYASGAAVKLAGAKPVFVDVGDDGLMDITQVARAITSRTRALLPVHLYGQPADMAPLMQLARERGLAVIEDCAQSHGATYQKQITGTFGDIAAFSFYPGKNLGAYGDSGAVATKRPEIARRVKSLRVLGSSPENRYFHELLGRNSRLDTLQAVVLNLKLRNLPSGNQCRAEAAKKFSEALRGVPGVSLPTVHRDRSHVFHLYVIQVPQRDEFLKRLHAEGIRAGIHYPYAMHEHPAFSELGYSPGTFPTAERLARQSLSLPLFPAITDEMILRVTSAVRKIASELAS